MDADVMRTALEARDAEAVVFHAGRGVPLTRPRRMGFRGSSRHHGALRIVFDTTSAFVFTEEVGADDSLVLRFRTHFQRRPVQGVIWLDLDKDGLVSEMWVFARPLAAVAAVGAAMGPGLAARHSPMLGVLARMFVRPLLVMAWLIDRVGTLLVRLLNDEHRQEVHVSGGSSAH
jgi:hypothetical protein